MTLNWRSAAVLAAVQVVACTAGSPQDGADGPVLSKWAALSSGSVEATQSIQSDWKSGYCSDITVKNSGTTPVTGWTVVMDLHQSAIGSSHSSKLTGRTFTPESYNATIAPGSSIKFGFCANATGIDYLATIASFSAIGGGGSASGGGMPGAAGAGASSVSGGAGGARAGAGNGGASAAGSAGAAGPAASAGAGGSPSKGGSASLTKTDEWNSGYCADVSITGSSNWTVVLDMRNSAVESGQLWSASYTTSGNRVTVTGNSSKFRFCARKTAASDWLAALSSVNGGSSGGNSGGTGASGGSAGASGGSAGASASGGATGGGTTGGGATGGSCPTINGTEGWTSRFWDCCKPHCGWSANVSGGNALNSCGAANQSYGTNYNVASACSGGGSAYMCYGLTPWAVSNTLAYGYAATPTGNDSCGKCYEVQFTGAGQYGNDPGSVALKGKTMIVQTINVGGDVGKNQLDIMVPGGGVGLFNACSSQWGVSNAQLGEQYGGLLATCKKELGYNASGAQSQSCLRNKCTGLFTDARGLGQLREGCLFYVGWFQAADNPKMVYKEVSCPAAIQAKSNLRAGAASSNACGG